jgi:hypothetical protein
MSILFGIHETFSWLTVGQYWENMTCLQTLSLSWRKIITAGTFTAPVTSAARNSTLLLHSTSTMLYTRCTIIKCLKESRLFSSSYRTLCEVTVNYRHFCYTYARIPLHQQGWDNVTLPIWASFHFFCVSLSLASQWQRRAQVRLCSRNHTISSLILWFLRLSCRYHLP